MTVKDAISLLAYGEDYYLIGAKSGKILFHSRRNKKARLEMFTDKEVYDTPFFGDFYRPPTKYGKPYTYPIIGIWVSGE